MLLCMWMDILIVSEIVSCVEIKSDKMISHGTSVLSIDLDIELCRSLYANTVHPSRLHPWLRGEIHYMQTPYIRHSLIYDFLPPVFNS